MKSGVYAARLLAGDAVDHVPFFVRPETGDPTAPAAFLVPTFSYMAYGNGRHTEDTAGKLLRLFRSRLQVSGQTGRPLHRR